jgi:hypothetical protein
MSQAVSRWYWARDGRQGGPITWEELQSMARTGMLRGHDLVWREGSPNWQPASTAQNDDSSLSMPSDASAAAPSPVTPISAPRQLLDEVEGAPRPVRRSAARHLIAGTLWLSGGILLTVISYQAAASSPHGGTYRIFTGAIIVGIIQFFRAIAAASGD